MKKGLWPVFLVLPRVSKLPHGGNTLQLMMMLSLNLLVLVFFMLLNSMASYEAKEREAVMSKEREGLPVTEGSAAEGENVPLAPLQAWHDATLSHLKGTILNRIDMHVPPQAANADALVVNVPLGKVFRANGSLLRPELVREVTMAAAGGRVGWTVVSPAAQAADVAPAMAELVKAGAGDVTWRAGNSRLLVIDMAPGELTKPDMGTEVEAIGAKVGAEVKGVAHE